MIPDVDIETKQTRIASSQFISHNSSRQTPPAGKLPNSQKYSQVKKQHKRSGKKNSGFRPVFSYSREPVTLSSPEGTIITARQEDQVLPPRSIQGSQLHEGKIHAGKKTRQK